MNNIEKKFEEYLKSVLDKQKTINLRCCCDC